MNTEYQNEVLQEAALFFVEHVFNQHVFRGIEAGPVRETSLMLKETQEPEDIKRILNEFIDQFTDANVSALVNQSPDLLE